MAAKNIAYDQEARENIRKGVNQLARAVKVTPSRISKARQG